MFTSFLFSPVLTFYIVAGSLLGTGPGGGSAQATGLGDQNTTKMGDMTIQDVKTANRLGGGDRDTKLTPSQKAVITASPVTLAANQPPVVVLIAPAEGTVITAGTDLYMIVGAADPKGSVAKVEFFRGRQKLGEDRSAPYTFTWKDVPAGRHTLRARATDNQGGVTTSVPLALTARK